MSQIIVYIFPYYLQMYNLDVTVPVVSKAIPEQES